MCVKLAAASARLFGKGEAALPGDNSGITDGSSPPQVRKHINDLYEDLRDGHNLISLLEVLSGVKLVSPQGWAGILETPSPNPLHPLPAPLHPQPSAVFSGFGFKCLSLFILLLSLILILLFTIIFIIVFFIDLFLLKPPFPRLVSHLIMVTFRVLFPLFLPSFTHSPPRCGSMFKIMDNSRI